MTIFKKNPLKIFSETQEYSKKSNLSNCQFEHNFLYKPIYTVYIGVKISWHLIGSSNFYLTNMSGKQSTY